MRSRRYKKKGPVRSKKVTYDGITFQSGLEKYMYIALKKAKIKAKYEGATYELIPSFNYNKPCYERQANGKGDYKNRVGSFLKCIYFILDQKLRSINLKIKKNATKP